MHLNGFDKFIIITALEIDSVLFKEDYHSCEQYIKLVLKIEFYILRII